MAKKDKHSENIQKKNKWKLLKSQQRQLRPLQQTNMVSNRVQSLAG